MDGEEVVVVIACSIGVVAGLAVLWMALNSRRQVREMEHRERLALIERGLVPAPEIDPVGFERAMGVRRLTESKGSIRTRSMGVIMVALGLGFSLMISFAAGSSAVGIGIGGAFALLGVAFIVNSVLMNQADATAANFAARDRAVRTEPPDRPAGLT